MRPVTRTILAVAVGFALVASMISCASTPKATGKSFIGDYEKNLQEGPKGGAKQRWLKPDVDFKKYSKVILEHVVFFFDDTSEYKGIDTAELDEVAKNADLALVSALKDKYPIVTEPGPDVVRIRFAITNLKASKPGIGVLTTVTMVTPIGLGVNLIKKGATGSWSGSGATGSEMMAIDSMTNEVNAVAKDDQSAAFFDRYTKYGSVEDAFKFWGERLVYFLDEVHGKLKKVE
jgi:hypothetical protein